MYYLVMEFGERIFIQLGVLITWECLGVWMDGWMDGWMDVCVGSGSGEGVGGGWMSRCVGV